MPVTGIKTILGFAITVLIFCFYNLFTLDYNPVNYTGNSITQVSVSETQVVNVASSEPYTLTVESCYPFKVTIDDENVIEGLPQNISGSRCGSSYYKLEEVVNGSKIEATTGDVTLSINSESPFGLVIGYPQETVDLAMRNARTIAILIWFVCIALLIFLK